MLCSKVQLLGLCPNRLVDWLNQGRHMKNIEACMLVVKVYILNLNIYRAVDYINNNRRNNCVDNLQWMTQRDNIIKEKRKSVVCINTGIVYKNYFRVAAASECDDGIVVRFVKIVSYQELDFCRN